MIEIIKELEIEVSKPNVFQAVVAKQYDMNTRFLKVTFVDNKEKISINNSDTVSVTINALRPDGQSKGFDGTINDDGTVTVPLHSWMLELVGTVVCDISAIDTKEGNSKKLTTTSFTLFVEQAAWGGEGMTSDPQYDILIQLINDCATARTNADIALEKSAEADAKYDACVEATDRANQIINSSGFLESVQEQNKQSCIKFWLGTSEEYEAQKDTIPWGTYCIFADDKTIEEQVNEIVEPFKEEINRKVNGVTIYSGTDTSAATVSNTDYSKFGRFVVFSRSESLGYNHVNRTTFENIHVSQGMAGGTSEAFELTSTSGDRTLTIEYVINSSVYKATLTKEGGTRVEFYKIVAYEY